MKQVVTIILSCTLSLAAFAQQPQIKIKKNKVSVDGKECLRTTTQLGAGTTFTDLQGNELFFLQHFTENDSYPAYAKIIFVQEKEMITNQNAFLSRKNLVNILIQNKVLVGCQIDPEQIEIFKLKFHEQVPPKQTVNIIQSDG